MNIKSDFFVQRELSALIGKAVAMPLEGSIEEVLEEAVERDPTHATTALLRQVDADGEEINRATYAELRVCVHALAAALRSCLEADCDLKSEQQSIGDRVVAICMEPCVERVAAILALWQLGLAFVPLDPKLPPARAHDMLRETRALAILTFNHCAPYATSVACALETRPRVLRFETLFARELFATAPFRGALRIPGVELPLAPPAPLNSPASQMPVSLESPGFPAQTFENETSESLEDTLSSSSLVPYEQYVLRFSEMARLAGRTQSDCGAALVPKQKQSLAAVIYTSGSSGRPKGVRLTHANLLSRLHWQWAELSFNTAHDIVLLKTSLLFVDSLSETFAAVGALVNAVIAPSNVVALPDKLLALLERYRISRLLMVPSPWREFLAYARLNSAAAVEALTSLKTLILSGELLTRSLVDATFELTAKLLPVSSGFRIVNLYGSTETTGDVAYELLTQPVGNAANVSTLATGADEDVPIGGPMWNTGLYVLGEDGQPVEEGAVGHLSVCGAHIADGYVVDQPQDSSCGSENSSQFMCNSLLSSASETYFFHSLTHFLFPALNAASSSKSLGLRVQETHVRAKSAEELNYPVSSVCRMRRMYSTGDLAVIRDGKLVLKGRSDAQVKLSGVRVHLSEVERAVRELPQFRDCEQLHAVAVKPPSDLEFEKPLFKPPSDLKFEKPLVVVLYVLKCEERDADTGELQLPDEFYANGHVPRFPFLFCELPAVPTQPHTGKLDRLALRQQAERCVTENIPKIARAMRFESTERKYYGGRFTGQVQRDVYAALYESLDRSPLVLGPAHRLGDVGFDSLGLTHLVLQLQDRGYFLEPFDLHSSGIATVGDLIAVCAKQSDATKQLPPSDEHRADALSERYEVETLKREHRKRVLQIFGDTFEKNVELHSHIGLRAEDLRRFLRKVLFAHFLRSGCSLVIRERASGALVAAALAIDADEFAASAAADGERIGSLVASLSRPMQVVAALIEHTDHQFEKFLHSAAAAELSVSKWLEITVLCVERRIVECAPQESLALTYWAEAECIRRGRQHAFRGVKTLNVSPVTIV